MFNDINLSWHERVEVSVYRLFEIIQDYLYNNNIDLPSVDNETNVESVKQLLEYWKEMLGEYVLITTTDKMPGAGTSFPACFMSYKFVNQPSEESDFLFSTFGNTHTGMAINVSLICKIHLLVIDMMRLMILFPGYVVA